MSVSNRFRDISKEVADYHTELENQGEAVARGVLEVKKACAEMAEWAEQVGEIPRMSLEYKLTPVLLKAHSCLDRSRLLFEEEGQEQQASLAWDLQQKIYRLLNDL